MVVENLDLAAKRMLADRESQDKKTRINLIKILIIDQYI